MVLNSEFQAQRFNRRFDMIRWQYAFLATMLALAPVTVMAQLKDLAAKAQMGLEPFARAAFDKAIAEKRPVLVAVSASWCPVCRVQENLIRRKLAPDAAFAAATFYRVDFDADKPNVAAFKASSQSTLIAFRDGKEIGRMVGSTDTGKIKAFAEQLVK
jgi:thioredoxin 1